MKSSYALLTALVLGGLWVAALPSQAAGETRRALLVGIDKYTDEESLKPNVSQGVRPNRASINNLNGCVADVEAIRAMLIAKYGFKPENIVMLTNKQASRQAILDNFRRHLIGSAQRGDATVFYYSGHGSQQKNSLSTEADKKDETIVPVDVLRNGMIRDKDLSALYHEVLDKGARLTVFSDSCHSGSIARGLSRPALVKMAPAQTRDVPLTDTPRESPEERGALIFSASQDQEPAIEHKGLDGGVNGAFTWGLLKAMRALPADESAERLFMNARAAMRADGVAQEPVLAGPPSRRSQPLFGDGTAKESPLTVAALAVSGGIVQLQGGLALGLTVGSELKSSGAAPARLRITKVSGPTRALAEVTEGVASGIKSGDLFEVDRLAVPTGAVLRLYVPATRFNSAELGRMKQGLAKLSTGNQVAWVSDPTHTSPDSVIEWQNGAWRSIGATGVRPIGQALGAGDLLAAVATRAVAKPKVYVNWPPSTELSGAIKAWAAKNPGAVELTADRAAAHYWLAGRASGKDLSYAWVLPNATQQQNGDTSPLPVRTDWLVLGPKAADAQAVAGRLADFAQRTAHVKSWLQLEAPAPDRQFPYHLALKNAQTGELKSQGPLKAKESYGLVLSLDKALAEDAGKGRYVYVFALDSFGNSRLLFPRKGQGNVENRLPYQEGLAKNGWPAEIPLGSSRLFQVQPPFGVDTYVMLASDEAIANPDVFERDGIRTRGAAGVPSAINELLSRGSTRGKPTISVKHGWALERLSFSTEPAKP